eukprot:3238388-Lingulodinium_polyedra.AAC.1
MSCAPTLLTPWMDPARRPGRTLLTSCSGSRPGSPKGVARSAGWEARSTARFGACGAGETLRPGYDVRRTDGVGCGITEMSGDSW